MKLDILDKNDCLKLNKKNSSYTLHPLINYITNIEHLNVDLCIVLPQLTNNKLNYIIQKDILDDNNDTKKDIYNINPVFNFSLPINSNNFLDIILNINTVNKLYEWFKSCDIENMDIIKLVLNLFWKNYYHILNDNLDDFYYFNQYLIKKIFKKDIKILIIAKIINKIIKKYYGNEIKYLVKIKKNLSKYI
jgi:hypothetical protein